MESSSRIRRANVKEDRLSSLPDSLIHEIFKFMDTKQVVATSLLSKRWNSLWRSNPYLNFVYEKTPGERDSSSFDEERVVRFESFVDQVLLPPDHNTALHAFYIKTYPYSIVEWVGHAIARHVQEVKLEIVPIYGSTLGMLCSMVKRLTLDGVDILCIEEGEALLLNCPIMETLVFHSCFFGNEHTFGNFKLSAPVLKVLRFEGGYFYNYTIDNLSSIVTAVVNVSICLDGRQDFLDNILRGLTNAKYLTFSLNDFPACSKVPITLNTVDTFHTLRHLKLTTSSAGGDEGDFSFSTSLKLLEKCPVIETLVLDGFLSWEQENMEENLVAELQSWCSRCHLKTLEIEGRRIVINDSAFKFIKCIMSNAASLKNVVLTTQDAEQENLVDICTRLEVKPKVTKVSSGRIQVSLKPSIKIQWESM